MTNESFAEFLERKEKEKMNKPEIVGKAAPYYEHAWSKHPDSVRISFSDGSTAVYDIRQDQPHPVIIENIRIIRKWKQGYVNQPARRRRRK